MVSWWVGRIVGVCYLRTDGFSVAGDAVGWVGCSSGLGCSIFWFDSGFLRLGLVSWCFLGFLSCCLCGRLWCVCVGLWIQLILGFGWLV